MNEQLVEDILSWQYDEPYDFYNIDVTPEVIKEMLEDEYYVVIDHVGGLLGFFCIGIPAQVPNDIYNYSEEFIDIGLGMKPELTGKEYGASFFSFVLDYITHSFEGISLRLTVASFNKRAIHLYSKFGFTKEFEFMKGTNSFTTMIK